jgi:deazaflavin-dependent oxidoreductase (nitroreductase family)
MTFDASSGTRGARHPQAGGISAWVSRRAVDRIRRRGGTFMGMRLLVLNTVGRKSGATRSNPLAWFPGDDGSWLVVASANGSSRNPSWYYNLAGNPERVSIDVDSVNVPVVAEQLSGDERDRAWQAITTGSPRFAGYESKTDRRIPVIRLTRRSGH